MDEQGFQSHKVHHAGRFGTEFEPRELVATRTEILLYSFHDPDPDP